MFRHNGEIAVHRSRRRDTISAHTCTLEIIYNISNCQARRVSLPHFALELMVYLAVKQISF